MMRRGRKISQDQSGTTEECRIKQSTQDRGGERGGGGGGEGRGLVSRQNCVAGNIGSRQRLTTDPEPPRVAAPTTRIYLFSALQPQHTPCLATPRLPTANSCISAAYITTSTHSPTHPPKIRISLSRMRKVPSRPFHDGGWNPKRVPAQRNTPPFRNKHQ